eukprot:COSAG04_NODE_2648_length_3800_cov_1.817617_6_plen_47_part_01
MPRLTLRRRWAQDYPRRHCGQNPVSTHECFDDVNHVKKSRVFLFRGA